MLDRREFIKLASLGSLGLVLGWGGNRGNDGDTSVSPKSKFFDAQRRPDKQYRDTQYLSDQEINLEMSPYVPNDKDEILLVITRADGSSGTIQCHVGYDDAERACSATLIDGAGNEVIVNDGRGSDYEWDLGITSGGYLVEAWVIREDGTKRKLDIKGKRSILPANPVGFNFDSVNTTQLRDYQPKEPVGSLVILTDIKGNKLYTSYQPEIGQYVRIWNADGVKIGSENWLDGTILVSGTKYQTNGNSVLYGGDFTSAMVNSREYIILPRPFKPSTLVGFELKLMER